MMMMMLIVVVVVVVVTIILILIVAICRVLYVSYWVDIVQQLLSLVTTRKDIFINVHLTNVVICIVAVGYRGLQSVEKEPCNFCENDRYCNKWLNQASVSCSSKVVQVGVSCCWTGCCAADMLFQVIIAQLTLHLQTTSVWFRHHHHSFDLLPYCVRETWPSSVVHVSHAMFLLHCIDCRAV